MSIIVAVLLLRFIMNIKTVLFGSKNITFGNVLTQQYRTYLLVCVWAECSFSQHGQGSLFVVSLIILVRENGLSTMSGLKGSMFPC